MNSAPYQPCAAIDWNRAETKFLFDIVLGKMLQPEPKAISDREVSYLRAANVQWATVDIEDLSTMYASEKEIETFKVAKGDLLVCEGGEVGRAAILDKAIPPDTIIQNALHRVRGKGEHNVRYLGYLLRHIADHDWFSVLCNKATIAHFTGEKFGDLLIWYPAPSLQEQIADFLDRETIRLDIMIAAKQKLLELLSEKRRTLITSAVTRGIDPKVRLKESGIPWLGEIPEHWDTKRVAFLFRERDERNQPDLPLLTVSINTGVSLREFSDDRIEGMAADPASYKVARKGDVAFNKMRMWQGAVGVSPTDGLVSPDYVVADPTEPMDVEYFGLLFKTQLFSAETARQSHGITWDRLRLYWEDFRDIRVPLPPVAEQAEIVKAVQEQTAKLDALKIATDRTIALLRERRTALIAAAVTGKIDIPEATA